MGLIINPNSDPTRFRVCSENIAQDAGKIKSSLHALLNVLSKISGFTLNMHVLPRKFRLRYSTVFETLISIQIIRYLESTISKTTLHKNHLTNKEVFE